MTDNINHPEHYNWHPAGIECVNVAEAFSYNVGTAMAYLWRHLHKGNADEDLRKALWHITREIHRLSSPHPGGPDAYGLDVPEEKIRGAQ